MTVGQNFRILILVTNWIKFVFISGEKQCRGIGGKDEGHHRATIYHDSLSGGFEQGGGKYCTSTFPKFEVWF